QSQCAEMIQDHGLERFDVCPDELEAVAAPRVQLESADEFLLRRLAGLHEGAHPDDLQKLPMAGALGRQFVLKSDDRPALPLGNGSVLAADEMDREAAPGHGPAHARPELLRGIGQNLVGQYLVAMILQLARKSLALVADILCRRSKVH